MFVPNIAWRIDGAIPSIHGNEQTSMTLNNGTPETRTYDAWGRLATRAQGKKNFTTEDTEKEKIMTRGVGADVTVYRHGAGWDPVVNENGSGTVLGAWVMTPGTRGKKLAYVTGGLQGAAPIYTYSDHLGSIRRARLQDVSSVGSDEFEPYGGVYASTGTLSALKLRHFAMHPEDTALQGYRAPYRIYSPAMVRWTSEDPLGMVDGPNVYGYAKSNSIKNRDSSGASIYVDVFWQPERPLSKTCFERALEIAESATGATTSIRHCVAVCEFKRCYGNIGGWVGTWANLISEHWWPSEVDWWDDINSGNDGALIPSPKCDENTDGYCTNKCRGMGW